MDRYARDLDDRTSWASVSAPLTDDLTDSWPVTVRDVW